MLYLSPFVVKLPVLYLIDWILIDIMFVKLLEGTSACLLACAAGVACFSFPPLPRLARGSAPLRSAAYEVDGKPISGPLKPLGKVRNQCQVAWLGGDGALALRSPHIDCAPARHTDADPPDAGNGNVPGGFLPAGPINHVLHIGGNRIGIARVGIHRAGWNQTVRGVAG